MGKKILSIFIFLSFFLGEEIKNFAYLSKNN